MCWREKRTLTWKGLKQSGNSPRTFSKLRMFLTPKPKSCSGGSLTEWCNNVGGSPTSSCLRTRRTRNLFFEDHTTGNSLTSRSILRWRLGQVFVLKFMNDECAPILVE